MKLSLLTQLPRLRALGVYGFALAAGLLAAWATREHIQARVREIEREAVVATADRLVAASDLPAGTRLQSSHLAIRAIPLPWMGSGTLDPDAVDLVIGTTLTNELKQGEALLDVHLSTEVPEAPLSDRVSAGRRAVTLPAAELNVSTGLLQPGDLIDLYVSFAHRGQHVTAPLLQGVRVLAITSGIDAAASVTLDASAQEAVKLVAARQGGTLTAMLRHHADGEAQPSSPSGDLAALMGIDARRDGPAPVVPVLYGDRLDAEPLPAGINDPAMPAPGASGAP